MAFTSNTTLLTAPSNPTKLFTFLHHPSPRTLLQAPKLSIKSLPVLASSSKFLNDEKFKLRVSSFMGFLMKEKDVKAMKEQLLEVIAPLERGAEAGEEDRELVDEIARKLEEANNVKEPLKSNLLNGKWELLYTTSDSLLKTKWPKFLRPNGKIYQAINLDTLRAQNIETWPYFNQATANLVPLNAKRVAVKFDHFKIAGLVPIKSQGSGRGQIEITYLDEELRITRGNQGNLFILKMVDPSYRVPTT